MHKNDLRNQDPHHLYEIRDRKKNDDVFKFGICGRPLLKDGTSPRANEQVEQFNNAFEWARFFANILRKNIPGRRAAKRLEDQRIADYVEKNGRRPRGNR